ncbi:hypothetical protein PAL_GLEAN10014311 [Pteropus alecto]|uniref:Uncharacterized protein n=1 Tax=Pteropus alecto TaxID=9402 RepID=L5L050_PTEAL|nr:hypothetical protein PAL_GLEAN10014311 [Pteropus alecto]
MQVDDDDDDEEEEEEEKEEEWTPFYASKPEAVCQAAAEQKQRGRGHCQEPQSKTHTPGPVYDAQHAGYEKAGTGPKPARARGLDQRRREQAWGAEETSWDVSLDGQNCAGGTVTSESSKAAAWRPSEHSMLTPEGHSCTSAPP